MTCPTEDLFEYYENNKHFFKFNGDNYIERDYFDPRFVKIYDEFCVKRGIWIEGVFKNNDKNDFLEYVTEKLETKIQQAQSTVIAGLVDFVNLPFYILIKEVVYKRLNNTDCLWDLCERLKFELFKYYENNKHCFKFNGFDYIDRDYFDPRFVKFYDEFSKKHEACCNNKIIFEAYMKKLIENKIQETCEQLKQVLGDFLYGERFLEYIITKLVHGLWT